jgi:hypothetical protein
VSESWDDIIRPPAPKTPEPSRLDILCARVLTTTDGQDLLKELRRQYFETAGNPHADDRALRVRAANQHFILHLEAARGRGMAALAAKKAV